MPIQIKPAGVLAEKYSRRAGTSGADYTAGVQAPRRPQAESAIAAADSYAAGITQAIQRQAFQKGLQRAGNEKWTRKSATVGAQRYPSGVTAAKDDWAKGVAPFLDTLATLTLPPRMPKGDPGNNQRVTVVTQALRARKLAGG